MGYRTVAKWEIDLPEATRDRGLLGWREFAGFGEYIQPISIKFRNREVRLTVRTSDITTLVEIRRSLYQLARIRYTYHHSHGTGNYRNRPEEEKDIETFLESVGINLPNWLR